jgi:hypothetical protein
VAALERSVLDAKGMVATVLRYGQLYGPGTSTVEPKGPSPVYVEAAAWAALLALQSSTGGRLQYRRGQRKTGTSHFLGRNFAKASEIRFLDQAGAQQYAWTTNWGVSTRLIGGLIMTPF